MPFRGRSGEKSGTPALVNASPRMCTIAPAPRLYPIHWYWSWGVLLKKRRTSATETMKVRVEPMFLVALNALNAPRLRPDRAMWSDERQKSAARRAARLGMPTKPSGI